jgi:hypothetical protein
MPTVFDSFSPSLDFDRPPIEGCLSSVQKPGSVQKLNSVWKSGVV